MIVYDRRGFGQSSRPTEGYDFDTLAADLDKVLTELDLRDVTLVGFSLGTGELARYIGTYGTDRLRPACSSRASRRRSSSPTRTRRRRPGGRRRRPAGDSRRPARVAHRAARGLPQPRRLPRQAGQRGDRAQRCGTPEPAPRRRRPGRAPHVARGLPEDIKRIDIPTLILHGTADRILSIEGQGRRLHAALPDAQYVEIEGGPHVMCVTHAKEVNRELLAFIAQAAAVRPTA